MRRRVSPATGRSARLPMAPRRDGRRGDGAGLRGERLGEWRSRVSRDRGDGLGRRIEPRVASLDSAVNPDRARGPGTGRPIRARRCDSQGGTRAAHAGVDFRPIRSSVRYPTGDGMRTYAPASTRAVLDQLLEEPSLARGVVHHEVRGARPADARGLAGLAGPADPGRPGEARHRAPVHPPGGRHRGGARGRGRRRRHAHRLGQVAVLHGAGPPGARGGPLGTGAVPVPHQGARPGPGRRVRGAGAGRRAWRSRRPATTGTRRRRSARRSARPGRSWSRTRTCSTRRSSPTTPSGSSCSSSSA